MMRERDKKLLLMAIANIYELDSMVVEMDCKNKEDFLNRSLAKRATASIISSTYECIKNMEESTLKLLRYNVFISKELRNKLVHSYGEVDFSYVWDFVVVPRKKIRMDMLRVLADQDSEEIDVDDISQKKSNILNKE